MKEKIILLVTIDLDYPDIRYRKGLIKDAKNNVVSCSIGGSYGSAKPRKIVKMVTKVN